MPRGSVKELTIRGELTGLAAVCRDDEDTGGRCEEDEGEEVREKFLLLVPVQFALERDGEYLGNEDGDQEGARSRMSSA